MGPIAKELEARLWVLADPCVQWVASTPHLSGQSCVLADYRGRKCTFPLSDSAEEWLNRFAGDYSGRRWGGAATFNDSCSRRRQVLWMFEEAIEEALEMGV